MERKTLFPLPARDLSELAHAKKSAPVQTSMHPWFEKASGVTERIIDVASRGQCKHAPGIRELHRRLHHFDAWHKMSLWTLSLKN